MRVWQAACQERDGAGGEFFFDTLLRGESPLGYESIPQERQGPALEPVNSGRLCLGSEVCRNVISARGNSRLFALVCEHVTQQLIMRHVSKIGSL